MKKVTVIIERAKDGFYSAYCEDNPMLFGGGDSVSEAKEELNETIRLTRELGRESAGCWPEWFDEEHEFEYRIDVPSLMDYYEGVITPTGIGRMAGINPKQMWSYAHGLTKPRKAQKAKIQDALHRLGQDLCSISF